MVRDHFLHHPQIKVLTHLVVQALFWYPRSHEAAPVFQCFLAQVCQRNCLPVFFLSFLLL